MTTGLRSASYARRCCVPGNGPNNVRGVHSLPSQAHVSPKVVPVALPPPKSTISPRALSYAIPPHDRAGGGLVGDIWVQFVPSHTHVSPKVMNPAPRPPNRT